VFLVRLAQAAQKQETEAPIEGPRRDLLPRLRMEAQPRGSLGVCSFLRNCLEHVLDERGLPRLLVQVAQDPMPSLW